MKYICLYSLLLMSPLINAQMISNGLYINEERNEFIIIRNDTIQFRYLNDGGLMSFLIGEGTLKMKKNGKCHIIPSPALIEKTSILYCHPRSDDSLSIQTLAQDSLPITYMWIKVLRLKDNNFDVATTDKNGRLFMDKEQIEYFDKEDVLVYTTLVGYTETEKKTVLEKGYDYVIKSCLQNEFPCHVLVNGKDIEISQSNEERIVIEKSNLCRKYKKLKKKGYFGETTTILKKITDDYPLSDFPFNMDVKSVH